MKTNNSEFMKNYKRIHPVELLPDYDLANFSEIHRYVDALSRHLWSDTPVYLKDFLISLINELNNRHTAVTDLQKSEIELEILKERVQYLKLELEAREEKTFFSTESETANQEEVTQLRTELKNESQQSEEYKTKLNDLQILITEQDRKLITQRQNYAAQSDHISSLNKTINQLKNDLEKAIEGRIRPQQSTEEVIESELIHELQAEIDKLKISREEKKTKIENLQEKLEESQQKASDQELLLLEKLEETHDTVSFREADLLDEITDLKESLEKENSSFVAFKEKYYNNMNMFEEQVRLLRTTFEERFIDLQKHYSASSNASIEQKEIEIRNLKQEVEVLRRKQISDPIPFETLVHSQGENITTLERENERFKDEIETLNKALDATEDRFLEAQEEVGQFFHDRITEMDQTLTEKNELVETLIYQNKERNREIEKLELEILELLEVVSKSYSVSLNEEE